MDVLALSAQFITIFAAAFLAFGMENLRERRRTSRWVRQHLSHLAQLLRSELGNLHRSRGDLDAQVEALDAWLAATGPAELSGLQWSAAATVYRATGLDLGTLLRSDALTVLPQPLALALTQLEGLGQTARGISDLLHEARRDVLPAWYERRAPLGAPDARRVRYLCSLLVAENELRGQVRPLLDEVVAQLEQWR